MSTTTTTIKISMVIAMLNVAMPIVVTISSGDGGGRNISGLDGDGGCDDVGDDCGGNDGGDIVGSEGGGDNDSDDGDDDIDGGSGSGASGDIK
ncbi:hypothetical protein AAZX31_04G066300 [Glycine max]